MNVCCSTNQNTGSSKNKGHICPENNIEYQSVPFSTVIQHLKKPWKNTIREQIYYFCSDPECEVVYFGEDNSVIKQAACRTLIGIKNNDINHSFICYCYDITYAEARADKQLKQFVIEQTKNKNCACESQNPSARCCLKEFKSLSNSTRNG